MSEEACNAPVRMRAAPLYAELAVATNFSFLRGASHPSVLVMRAMELGMTGIGIADRNTVAGVVRAHVALRQTRDQAQAAGQDPPDFRLVVGARLAFADGTPDILAYPATRYGWGRLTRLLTVGNRRAKKGDCILRIEDLIRHLDDLLLIVTFSSSQPRPELEKEMPAGAGMTNILHQLQNAAPRRVWLGAVMNRSGRDARMLSRAEALAAEAGVPIIALNDAVYAMPEDKPLHDVLTAIRLGTTVQAAGRNLPINAERHLKGPGEMARLFAAAPEAIVETQRFLGRIQPCITSDSDRRWQAVPRDQVAHVEGVTARKRRGGARIVGVGGGIRRAETRRGLVVRVQFGGGRGEAMDTVVGYALRHARSDVGTGK